MTENNSQKKKLNAAITILITIAVILPVSTVIANDGQQTPDRSITDIDEDENNIINPLMSITADGDEYFSHTSRSDSDSDGDGFDDSTTVSFDVSTTYEGEGTVSVSVTAALEYYANNQWITVHSGVKTLNIDGNFGWESGEITLTVPNTIQGLKTYTIHLRLFDASNNLEDEHTGLTAQLYPTGHNPKEYLDTVRTELWDRDLDGKDDKVWVKMRVRTDSETQVPVTIEGLLFPPSGPPYVDSYRMSFNILPSTSNWYYMNLSVPVDGPEGNYSVHVYLEDNQYEHLEDEKTIDLTRELYPPYKPPELNIYIGQENYEGLVAEEIFITGFATGDLPPFDFEWDFGNGDMQYDANNEGESTVSTYYYGAGTYEITLIVTDDMGNIRVDTAEIQIMVSNEHNEFIYWPDCHFTPYDSDSDGYDDSVEVKVKAETEPGVTVDVTVIGQLFDPIHLLSGVSESTTWTITGIEGDYGYLHLTTSAWSDPGDYSVELTLFDEYGYQEDYEYFSEIIQLYPLGFAENGDEFLYAISDPCPFSRDGNSAPDSIEIHFDVLTDEGLTVEVTVWGSLYHHYWDGEEECFDRIVSNSITFETDWIYSGSHELQIHLPATAPEGYYDVNLRVVDQFGGYFEDEWSSYYNLGYEYYLYPSSTETPIADFSFNPTPLYALYEINFIDESIDPDGEIVSWYWDFGDGETSTDRNPCNQYQSGGVYTIKLKVTDNFGAINIISKLLTVYDLPIVNFIYEPLPVVSTNDIVKFSDLSYDISDSTIVNWEWDFGDGSISGRQNPYHQYLNEGVYEVILTIMNENGAINSFKRPIQVFEYGYSPAVFVDDDFDELTLGWQIDHYDSIQDGIDAALEGDIVYVHTGIYYETINIEKKIILLGEDRDNTIIDAIYETEAPMAVNLYDDDIVISGFCIQNCHPYSWAAGIRDATNGDNLIIHNNLIKNNNKFGILIMHGDNAIIKENIIHDNGYAGIQLYQGNSNCIITSNTINNNGDYGIKIFGSKVMRNVIYKNEIIEHNIGIDMVHDFQGFTRQNKIYNNNFLNNLIHILNNADNTWDDSYQSGGNYWDDNSNFVDELSGPNQDIPGSDGICDVPYLVSDNNQDRYPLMQPWIPTLCGDANGDGLVNVGDSVFLISYIFKGGAAPNPLCSGDVNGDGETNVGDAVYLINYIFRGGTPPVDSCCSDQ